MTRFLLPLLALTVSAGCAAETADDADRALELGTGSWRFEPVEDGQEVELIRGAQGGWHVWVALRTTGVDDDQLPMVLEVQPADDSRPAQITEVPIRLDPPDDEGRRKLVGWPAILEDPSCLIGEMIRVEARLSMQDDGTELVAERYLVPSGGAYPPPPCGE